MAGSENVEAGAQVSELFMLRLRYKEARLVRAGGDSPILLTDRQTAWVVYTGRVDVFLVPVANGRVAGTRRHLFRAETGQAVFGVSADEGGSGAVPSDGVALLAVGGPDTQLLQVRRSALEKFAQGPQFVNQVIELIDHWVAGLLGSIARQAPPQDITVLEPGREIRLEEGQAAHPNRDILWVQHIEGCSQFMGIEALPLMGEGFLPLSNRTWLQSCGAGRLRAINTKELVGEGLAWTALDGFHGLALECIRWTTAQAEQAERGRWQRRIEADERQVAQALSQLAGILEPRAITHLEGEGPSADPLLAACQWVGQAMGVAIQSPPVVPAGRATADPLAAIARASRIRTRRVALRGEWYREEGGPVLAYLAADQPTRLTDGSAGPAEWNDGGRPVALLPASGRRPRVAGCYDLLDPVAQVRAPVTAQVAASVSPFGYVFYKPLPDRALTDLDLLRLGLQGSRRDVLTILLVALGMGGLSMVTPLATGILFDTVIPGVYRNQLVELGLALLVSAVAAALFHLTRNIAVLRLESKLEESVQAALWDRLLRLPAPFFRQYTAGDLAVRILGISSMRQVLSEVVISSVLSGLFSILNLILLFYYAPGLAWSATGLVLLFVSVTVIVGYVQVRHQRALTDVQGRISGLVLQLVTGIAKLRMAGVEGRAFARWAREFSRQRGIAFQSRMLSNGLQVFSSAFPVLALLIIFALMGLSAEGSGLSTGAFLAFNAAFTQFLVASLAVSSAWIWILSVVPMYERVRPVLQAVPEVDPAKADPGTLAGEIEISHVAFRYADSEPLVLKDVSLHIRPGEFVAIVGASGCGKSTLLRLLLKFETPASGAIYYDGQDLERLDVEAVRRQIGVVLQDGKLLSGSILSNIAGSSLLTIEDVWEAARLVGLDQDIQEMPMGMHTVLSEGGGNLSGGQRQRLLIARAIINKPRLLFFDEATSALDNPNQALVSASLERLSATRVVIAHRLSTIVNADRIHVFDEGRVVQSGTYAELMRQRGPFAELAKRQLA